MKSGWGVRAAIALVTISMAAVSATSQPLSARAHRATAGHGYVPGSAIRTGGPIHGMILANAGHPDAERQDRLTPVKLRCCGTDSLCRRPFLWHACAISDGRPFVAQVCHIKAARTVSSFLDTEK